MEKKRNRVVQILMDRDGMTESEAIVAVENCQSELMDAVYGTSCKDPEDVIADELGLEPDYIVDLI